MDTLFVVATPIGNLEDITLRAIRTLREADVILAEDTRVAAKLLSHLGISGKPVWRYDEHSHDRMTARILDALRHGKKLALTTDAGTPGISDPGARLVSAIAAADPSATITPIPGPSALSAILSISGMRWEAFTFLGFPPHKKGRKSFFDSLAGRREPVVLFESPHRIERTLRELAAACGAERRTVLGRELTKLHEEIMRGTLAEVTSTLAGRTMKGEFVLVLAPADV